mgnify:CR=1 FL=1
MGLVWDPKKISFLGKNSQKVQKTWFFDVVDLNKSKLILRKLSWPDYVRAIILPDVL